MSTLSRQSPADYEKEFRRLFIEKVIDPDQLLSLAIQQGCLRGYYQGLQDQQSILGELSFDSFYRMAIRMATRFQTSTRYQRLVQAAGEAEDSDDNEEEDNGEEEESGSDEEDEEEESGSDEDGEEEEAGSDEEDEEEEAGSDEDGEEKEAGRDEEDEEVVSEESSMFDLGSSSSEDASEVMRRGLRYRNRVWYSNGRPAPRVTQRRSVVGPTIDLTSPDRQVVTEDL